MKGDADAERRWAVTLGTAGGGGRGGAWWRGGPGCGPAGPRQLLRAAATEPGWRLHSARRRPAPRRPPLPRLRSAGRRAGPGRAARGEVGRRPARGGGHVRSCARWPGPGSALPPLGWRWTREPGLGQVLRQRVGPSPSRQAGAPPRPPGGGRPSAWPVPGPPPAGSQSGALASALPRVWRPDLPEAAATPAGPAVGSARRESTSLRVRRAPLRPAPPAAPPKVAHPCPHLRQPVQRPDAGAEGAAVQSWVEPRGWCVGCALSLRRQLSRFPLLVGLGGGLHPSSLGILPRAWGCV